jgi:hypothetical protein
MWLNLWRTPKIINYHYSSSKFIFCLPMIIFFVSFHSFIPYVHTLGFANKNRKTLRANALSQTWYGITHSISNSWVVSSVIIWLRMMIMPWVTITSMYARSSRGNVTIKRQLHAMRRAKQKKSLLVSERHWSCVIENF